MKTILFTNNSFSEKDIEYLKKKNIAIKKAGGDLNEEELIKALKNCQGYIIGGTDKATKKVIESTNLEIIIFYGTGYENYVDVKSAKKKGIAVAYTPKANAYTVAEHTVALILDSVKNITHLNNSVKKGKWPRRQTWNLEGKTLGVLGMGTIGQHVAKIMYDGFGMQVIYTSRSRKLEAEKTLKAKKVSLQKLMSSSDVLTIHAPYSSETLEIIGKDELNTMKPHAVLINASRAELVDGKALSQALTKGKLASAAFDAYYIEPAPKKEKDKWGLLSLPDKQFILTPHTAYGSKEAVENMNEMVVKNLEAFFKGNKPPYSVD